MQAQSHILIVSFQPLQYQCKELHKKIDKKIHIFSIVMATNLNTCTSYSCELHPDNEANDEDSDWLVHNHFDVLPEQMATLQAQLINMKIY